MGRAQLLVLSKQVCSLQCIIETISALFSISPGAVHHPEHVARPPGPDERLRDELQHHVRSDLRHRRCGKDQNVHQRMRAQIGELFIQNQCVPHTTFD